MNARTKILAVEKVRHGRGINAVCPAVVIDRIVEIRMPRVVLFGIGSRKELPLRARTLSAGPWLIVTDSGLARTEVVKEIKRLMFEAGIKVHIFNGVEPDPRVEIVERCRKAIISTGAKAVIGVGGGSSLDIAKAAAIMVNNDGKIMDYAGVEKLPKKGLPVILLPTTAGTGSEVTPIVVLSNKKEQLKIGIVSQHLYCDVAIIDPELTKSCPASITASSGMDTLTHAIEVYTNKFSVSIIDTLAIESIRLVGQHLRKCVRDSDLVSRQGMSLASLYAGLGLGPVNTAAVHALAYPLGGMFDIPHGLANAVLLPYVLEFNLPACVSKFAKIAEALGVKGKKGAREKALAGVEMVKKLSQDIGIFRRLRDFGIPENAIPEMAVAVLKVTRLLNNNPREITLEDAKEIYRRAY